MADAKALRREEGVSACANWRMQSGQQAEPGQSEREGFILRDQQGAAAEGF